jgi:nucleoid-associated protein YgaU
LQNLVIALVLIALALLVAGVFVFHQFGPDLGLTPLPEMESRTPEPDDPMVQVTVGGDPKIDEINEEARQAMSLERIRESIEQQPGIIPPSERETMDDQRRIAHVVRKGETLTSLARDYLGDGRLAQKILEANPSLLRPEDLQEGQKILIPMREAR